MYIVGTCREVENSGGKSCEWPQSALMLIECQFLCPLDVCIRVCMCRLVLCQANLRLARTILRHPDGPIHFPGPHISLENPAYHTRKDLLCTLRTLCLHMRLKSFYLFTTPMLLRFPTSPIPFSISPAQEPTHPYIL